MTSLNLVVFNFLKLFLYVHERKNPLGIFSSLERKIFKDTHSAVQTLDLFPVQKAEKKYSIDQEKLLKFEAEGQEFVTFFRSLE